MNHSNAAIVVCFVKVATSTCELGIVHPLLATDWVHHCWLFSTDCGAEVASNLCHRFSCCQRWRDLMKSPDWSGLSFTGFRGESRGSSPQRASRGGCSYAAAMHCWMSLKSDWVVAGERKTIHGIGGCFAVVAGHLSQISVCLLLQRERLADWASSEAKSHL